jgi:hypothetical protein
LTIQIPHCGLYLLVAVLCGCTSVPLKEAGTLSSYQQLGPAKGDITKSRIFVDERALATVKTVAIEPASFSGPAADRVVAERDRRLVSNAIDRSICIGLSDGYQVVDRSEKPDLVIRVVVTDLVPTDRTIAGISTVASLGSSAVLPVGVPRLPFGLGGLAVEAEALDPTGAQRAAVVWSRGANSITNNARLSQVGDAYSLAATFGTYFSKLLVSKRPPSGFDLSLPSSQRLQSSFGGRPKYAACETFGRSPGIAGAVAERVGAPPEWTDAAAD